MQKIYHKCAALLLAVGLLIPCTTALAQVPEESSLVVGLSSVDSGLPPTLDNGVVVVVWESEACYSEAGSALDKLPLTVEINAGHKSADGGVGEYTGIYSVGVHWNTADVDCTRPGTYDITGTLDSEKLSVLGITNPDGLTAALTVVVQKRGPIETLLGRLRSMNESYMRFQLYFPLLPNDATALYVERETEPDVWERLSVPMEIDDDGNPQTNFLEFSPKNPPEQLISYYLSPPVPQLRLRIEVVGSLYAGISNTVEVLANDGGATLPPPKPEDKPDNDDDNDNREDGSSGGNRGGGTQGETERPGKEPPKESAPEIPAPVVEAPPTHPPESSAPSESGAASAIPDAAESTSPVSVEPQTLEARAPIVEPSSAAEPQSPPDKGNAGAVAAATIALLTVGAGGIYLFKIRRKP